MTLSHTEVAVGTTLSFRKTMTVAEQAMFTGISGNLGPLYVDALKAKAAGADNMVVFELAATSLVTTALSRIGGPSRRIAKIEVDYPAPIFVGDSIEASAEVVAVHQDTVLCRLRGTRLPGGDLVFEGNATLAPLRG